MKVKQNSKFAHVTAELKASIEGVIEQATRHTYDSVKVANAYNKAFDKNEKPSTCSSCNIRMVRELRAFMGQYAEANKPPVPKLVGVKVGQTRTPLEYQEGVPAALLVIDVDSETGAALYGDGVTIVADGEYKTALDGTLIVKDGKGEYTAPNDVLKRDTTDEDGKPLLTRKVGEYEQAVKGAVDASAKLNEAMSAQDYDAFTLADGRTLYVGKELKGAFLDANTPAPAGEYITDDLIVIEVGEDGIATINEPDEVYDLYTDHTGLGYYIGATSGAALYEDGEVIPVGVYKVDVGAIHVNEEGVGVFHVEQPKGFALADGRFLVIGEDGIANIDGKKAKAGTYALADGSGKYSVNVIGNANFKPAEEVK